MSSQDNLLSLAKMQLGPRSAPVGIPISDVQPEEVRWLWSGRLPLGKLAVLDGDPGLGKSTVTLDIAARVTEQRCRMEAQG